jgi:hypothetical protein
VNRKKKMMKVINLQEIFEFLVYNMKYEFFSKNADQVSDFLIQFSKKMYFSFFINPSKTDQLSLSSSSSSSSSSSPSLLVTYNLLNFGVICKMLNLYLCFNENGKLQLSLCGLVKKLESVVVVLLLKSDDGIIRFIIYHCILFMRKFCLKTFEEVEIRQSFYNLIYRLLNLYTKYFSSPFSSSFNMFGEILGNFQLFISHNIPGQEDECVVNRLIGCVLDIEENDDDVVRNSYTSLEKDIFGVLLKRLEVNKDSFKNAIKKKSHDLISLHTKLDSSKKKKRIECLNFLKKLLEI